jgi:hypothetical protein
MSSGEPDERADVLFGSMATPAVARLLMVGFDMLPIDQQTALIVDLRAAQDQIIGACWRSTMESGEVEQVCPDTPDDLFDPKEILLRFRKHPEP